MTSLFTPGTVHLRLPDWVAPSEHAVAAAELTVLGWGAETGAPGPVASWLALQWVVADNGTPSPATNTRCEPTRARAVAEFEVGDAIATGAPYPAPEWFDGYGLAPGARPDQRWWATLAGSAWGREVGRGAATALGWLLGTLPDPARMVPVLYEDGSTVPDDERRRWTEQLLGRIG